jgi:hypothetical protein
MISLRSRHKMPFPASQKLNAEINKDEIRCPIRLGQFHTCPCQDALRDEDISLRSCKRAVVHPNETRLEKWNKINTCDALV